MANKKIKELGTPWKEPNVIIGLPCQDVVCANTAQSIAANIIEAKGIVSDILVKQTCDIVSSRTWLVREALKKGATHILFVDSDMFFASDTLNILLAHDKDIIGVDYNKRQFPLQSLAVAVEESEVSKTEPYRVKAMGMGVVLIKLSIFEKMPIPWFNFGRGSEGQLVLGEDVWFINTARDAGIDSWVDPKIKVGHVGQYIY